MVRRSDKSVEQASVRFAASVLRKIVVHRFVWFKRRPLRRAMAGAAVDPPAAPVHTLEPVQPILQPDPPATSPNRSVIHLTKSPRPSEALAPKIAAALEAHRAPSPVDAEPVPVTLLDRKSTRLNSSHLNVSRMPSSA
jgi:hypothetical protein